jgi:hypothetical protein
MNVALILVIIVILVIVFYMVYYVQTASQSVLDLLKTNDVIPSKDISNPASTSFSYNMWVYVNTWSSNNEKVIVYAETPGSVKKFKLYLDATSPTLKADILTTAPTSSTKTVIITNNFPIQRWVYIVVSVEGPVVDCYLDGKLVKSQQLQYLPDMAGDYSIKYGNFDAFLTKFSRIAKPTDPQMAWNDYMTGNGFAATVGPSYGFSFVVTKDAKEIAQYQYK